MAYLWEILRYVGAWGGTIAIIAAIIRVLTR